jgi:hypothetical protein
MATNIGRCRNLKPTTIRTAAARGQLERLLGTTPG